MLAARGLREDEDGRVSRLEREQVSRVRRQAIGVLWRSALTALVLTGTAFLASRPSFLPRPDE